MSVDTTPTQSPTGTTDTNASPWRVTRVILGSVAAGAITALVLTLAVFPGASEATITGSMLFGFGVGWAILAVVSERKTQQPQRWARVPAAAMTATGAGLITWAPADAAMTTLNWVWPPLMVALVGWMVVQVRRSLPGRSRLLLAPVFVVLALSAIGAGLQDVTATQVRHDYPAPGRTYVVNGHRLHIDCEGQGGPTVILFSGLGEFSASWARITDQVSTTTRVCAYDRAGQGWSGDVDQPQDGITAARDLHALLAAAGEHGPFVLVGHSIGGPYAMDYAVTYPEDVAGMVLLDSSSPRQLTDIANYATQYQLMKRGLALMPTLARIGLGPVVSSPSHLPGDEGVRAHAMGSTVRAQRNGRDELATIPAVFKQAQALTTLGDTPLAVVTASENVHTGGWVAAQNWMASLSTNSVHGYVESSHAGLLEDAHGSAASIQAVIAVVRAVNSGSAVASR